ncbi:MAG: hypothetical protein ACJ748_08715 [Flavisolibacter sp.]
MLHTISWQSYWITLALLSGIYYLVIYLLYFRNKLDISSNPKSNQEFYSANTNCDEQTLTEFRQKQRSLFGEQLSSEFSTPSENTVENLVYGCMDEINAFFEQAKKTKWLKNNLINSLRSILNKYPSLKDSEYKESISNVLVTECEHNCSVHLNAEDVIHVWLG